MYLPTWSLSIFQLVRILLIGNKFNIFQSFVEQNCKSYSDYFLFLFHQHIISKHCKSGSFSYFSVKNIFPGTHRFWSKVCVALGRVKVLTILSNCILFLSFRSQSQYFPFLFAILTKTSFSAYLSFLLKAASWRDRYI